MVEPSSAELPAFGSVTLRVTAYSDMWGQYQDQMVCMVSGINYATYISMVFFCMIRVAELYHYANISFVFFKCWGKILRHVIKLDVKNLCILYARIRFHSMCTTTHTCVKYFFSPQVQGLESTSIAIQIGFVGCPIEFQPTATRAKTLVRYFDKILM